MLLRRVTTMASSTFVVGWAPCTGLPNAITLSCKAARRPGLTAARWLPRLTLASEGAMCSHRDAEQFCSAHASGSAALSACEGS